MTQTDGRHGGQDAEPHRDEAERHLRDRLAALETELAGAEAQIQRERDIRQREVSEHLAQRDRLETRLADLRAAAAEAAGEAVEAQAAQSQAEAQSRSALADLDTEAARRTELEGLIESTRAKLEAAEQRHGEVAAQLVAHTEEALRDRERMESTRADAEASLTTASDRARGLEKVLDTTRVAAETDAKAAAEALAASVEARQQLESRLAQLRAAVDDAHRDTELAEAARQEASERIAALEGEVVRLRGLEQELAATTVRLQASLRQRQAEHDARSTERSQRDRRTQDAIEMMQSLHARTAEALKADAASARADNERLAAALAAADRDIERSRETFAALRSTWLRRRIMRFLGLEPRAPAGDEKL